jgi:hypothetical protein
MECAIDPIPLKARIDPVSEDNKQSQKRIENDQTAMLGLKKSKKETGIDVGNMPMEEG